MNRFLLQIIRWLAPLFRPFKIDSEQLHLILEAKLLMDSRRPSMFNQRYNKKEVKGQDWLAMGLFFFFGLMFLLMFAVFHKASTAFVLYFLGWMVALSMTLISDFTEVLIDPRDNYILLPRPVDDQTIAIARILHILLYISKLAFAFALPGIIFVSIYFGVLYLPLYLLQMLISVVLTIFLVNLTYLLLLRVVPADRFKEAINYFQIVFTILIFAVYYLFPRLIDRAAVENADILATPISWLFPPTWLGALWATLAEWNFSPAMLGLSLLALTTPVLSLYAISNFLAQDFGQRMFAISHGSASKPKKEAKRKATTSSWLQWIASRVTKTKAERAAFDWSWKLMLRSRDFKLKVYPALAIVPFIFVYFGLDGEGSLQERYARIVEGSSYIILIYFCLILLSNPFIMSFHSKKSQAAWLFYAHALKRPGDVMIGTFKAVLVQFFFPTIIFLFGVSLVIWGPKVIDDFIFGMINIMLLGVLLGLIKSKKLPFSDPYENQDKGDSSVTNIITFILSGILGTIHYFLLVDKPLIIIGLTLLSALLFLRALKKYRQTSWNQLNY